MAERHARRVGASSEDVVPEIFWKKSAAMNPHPKYETVSASIPATQPTDLFDSSIWTYFEFLSELCQGLLLAVYLSPKCDRELPFVGENKAIFDSPQGPHKFLGGEFNILERATAFCPLDRRFVARWGLHYGVRLRGLW